MIMLPNNNLGLTIMFIAVALVAIIPFVLAFWLMLKIAPWWVALPIGIAASFLALLFTLKFKPDTQHE